MTLSDKPTHKTLDDKIRVELERFRVQAQKIGFRVVKNRSDGMMAFRSWHFETNFVHGEGRVILTQDRTAGDRSNARKVTIYCRGRSVRTGKACRAELEKVVA